MQSRNTSTLTERIAIYKFFQGKDLSGYEQVFLFPPFGLPPHKKTVDFSYKICYTKKRWRCKTAGSARYRILQMTENLDWLFQLKLRIAQKNMGETGYMLDLFHNKILICSLVAWLVAQVLKAAIYAVINRGIDWKRFIGDGGMPSGHSATVSALAVSAGFSCGWASFEFAIAVIVAIIVMHDAMGVRHETGKQAQLLTEISNILENLTNRELAEENLKLFVGHTPFQVMIGSSLGIIVALLFFA